MICTNCGYQHLDVHRTRKEVITYCQNCSAENKSQAPADQNKPVLDILDAKHKKQKQKLMNSLSPEARKRLRVG